MTADFDFKPLNVERMQSEEVTAVQMAIGRIIKMASRPFQEGDVQEFLRCRDIVMAFSPGFMAYAPNWAAERLNGAQGD